MKQVPHQTKGEMKKTLPGVAGPAPIKKARGHKFESQTVGSTKGSKQKDGCHGGGKY